MGAVVVYLSARVHWGQSMPTTETCLRSDGPSKACITHMLTKPGMALHTNSCEQAACAPKVTAGACTSAKLIINASLTTDMHWPSLKTKETQTQP